MAASRSKQDTKSRKLASHVHVNGEVYGPDDDVPAEVAELITNPKAWASEADESADESAAESGE